MEWIRHGERFVYDNEWMSVSLVDVEIPGDRRFEHHAMHSADAAATVVIDPERGVLLLWRHRVLTNTWGWEVPAGRIDRGETAEIAARRETLEETGWEPGPLRHGLTYHPVNGISPMQFHVFLADGAIWRREPTDTSEASRIEWATVGQLRRIIANHEMPDGLSLTACLYALAVAGLD
jgi:8-oxo-dGTP pyrophosphatase MutT (NUDIX family)